MITSSQTSYLASLFGDAAAIRMMADAGFEAFDMSLFDVTLDPSYELNGPDYRQKAARLREIADECGIVCNQAHAPFPSSTDDEVQTAEIFRQIVRSMEIASILGAKVIVVHPMQHLRYIGNEETLKQMNLQFYRALMPYAEKYNIKVAAENMWQYEVDHIDHSTCSRPSEFCAYLDEVGSEWLIACLDLGHAALVKEDPAKMIHSLGRKRLQALHVHDVDFVSDLHTLPFLSKVDYESIIQALADISYQGDITLEAEHFLYGVPKGLIPAALRYMYETARYVADRVTEKMQR